MSCCLSGTKPLSETLLPYCLLDQWQQISIYYSDVIMGVMASQITSLNPLFRRRSKKTSKLSVTGLCAGNSPVTGEFPAQMASNAENVSFWLRHNAKFNHNATIFIQENLLESVICKMASILSGPQYIHSCGVRILFPNIHGWWDSERMPPSLFDDRHIPLQ